MNCSSRIATVFVAVSLAVLAPAAADFRQYSPPGGFGERGERNREVVEAGIANARWRFGRVYLDPWAGLTNASRVDIDRSRAVGGGVDRRDFTATFHAGLRAYVPTDSGLVVAAHALPGYVWWDQQSDRRRFNGLYGVGLFGDVGRVDLELSARRVEDARFFSRQFEEQVNFKEESLVAAAEVELPRDFSVFAVVSPRTVEFESDDVLFSADRVNRDEWIARYGGRYRFGGGLTVAAGLEESEADLGADDPRTNSGTSPIFEIEWDRSPVRIELHAQLRDLQSDILPGLRYEETTGRFDAGWRVTGPVRLEFATRRSLVYSPQNEWAWYSDEATGFAVRWSLRAVASIRVFLEEGTNDYQPLPGAAARADDFETLGATVRFNLGRARLEVGLTETEYDSNLDNFDRKVTSLITGVRFDQREFSPWG